ncbi:LysR family transcriptional regulator substrate-binding protein [Secundilactobacillus paracollinoides]|uniref:LysR family transcriptional regulator substrate-binding protein n=1 Tax=Secundilactobacillus paracollinoides TaxID=240427 RepID=UPI000AB34C8F|nr:LysR family transcriptional regulator substrate-binding protein [Secundilactobacillus paracollinoides]
MYRRFRNIFNQTFFEQDINPFIASYCDDARTAVQLANAKLGVALVPESVGLAYLGIGVTIHPINFAGWRTQAKLLWPKDTAASPLLKLFIQQFHD